MEKMYNNIYVNIITAVLSLSLVLLFGNILTPLLKRMRLISSGAAIDASEEKNPGSLGTALCIGSTVASAVGVMLLCIFSDDISFDTRISPMFYVCEVLVILAAAVGFYSDVLETRGKKGGITNSAYFFTEVIISFAFLIAKYYLDNSTEINIPYKGNVNLGMLYYPLMFVVMILIEESFRITSKSAGNAAGISAVYFLGGMAVFSQTESREISMLCASFAGAAMGEIVINSPSLKILDGKSGRLFFGISSAVMAVISENAIVMCVSLIPVFVDSIKYLLTKRKAKVHTKKAYIERVFEFFLFGIISVILSLILFYTG